MAQAQPVQPVPEPGEANRDRQFCPAALLQFHQCQVRLPLDPLAQRLLVFAQAGPAVAADLLGSAMAPLLLLLPEPRHAAATHAKAPADFARAFVFSARCEDPFPQILTYTIGY